MCFSSRVLASVVIVAFAIAVVAVVTVAAVNMRSCLHGMHDNTLLQLPDKGRQVKVSSDKQPPIPFILDE